MLTRDGADWLLQCRVQARARRDEFAGEHDGAIKIRIQAPPANGAANKALMAFLAGRFGVNKARVTLERGQAARHKRVRIHGADGQPPAPPPELLG
jgi:uncharacterized protein (TIGR00251 family)